MIEASYLHVNIFQHVIRKNILSHTESEKDCNCNMQVQKNTQVNIQKLLCTS